MPSWVTLHGIGLAQTGILADKSILGSIGSYSVTGIKTLGHHKHDNIFLLFQAQENDPDVEDKEETGTTENGLEIHLNADLLYFFTVVCLKCSP